MESPLKNLRQGSVAGTRTWIGPNFAAGAFKWHAHIPPFQKQTEYQSHPSTLADGPAARDHIE